MFHRFVPIVLLACVWLSPAGRAADAIPPIARVLPPVGLEIPADVRTRLEKRLAEAKQRLKDIRESPLLADVEVFTKAVELALAHREFYVERDFAKADWALDEANKRMDSLAKGRCALDQGYGPGRPRLPLVDRRLRSAVWPGHPAGARFQQALPALRLAARPRRQEHRPALPAGASDSARARSRRRARSWCIPSAGTASAGSTPARSMFWKWSSKSGGGTRSTRTAWC